VHRDSAPKGGGALRWCGYFFGPKLSGYGKMKVFRFRVGTVCAYKIGFEFYSHCILGEENGGSRCFEDDQGQRSQIR
jgi:hypothetical protein